MRGQASGKIERQLFWRCGGPHIAKMTHGAVFFCLAVLFYLFVPQAYRGKMGGGLDGKGIEEALGNNKWNSTTLGALHLLSFFFFEIKKMRV